MCHLYVIKLYSVYFGLCVCYMQLHVDLENRKKSLSNVEPQPDGGNQQTIVGLSVTAGVMFVITVIACILYAAKGR